MKAVIYEDNGWIKQSLVLDTMSPLEGHIGVPYNPPDITRLDWNEITRELNNLLVKRGLIDLNDLNGQGINLLRNAVQIVITKRIISLYKSKEAINNE